MNGRLQTVILRVITIVAVAFSISTQLYGQDAVLMDDDTSRCDIFRALSPQVPDECRLGANSRFGAKSLVIETDAAPRPRESYELAQQIQFEFDSYELTSKSKQELDQVADVLKDPLVAEKFFLIEGHADSTGPEDYNLVLSQKRAQAVHRYLQQHHGILGSRILAAGKGETAPYLPERPEDQINRRVEFVNLTDK